MWSTILLNSTPRSLTVHLSQRIRDAVEVIERFGGGCSRRTQNESTKSYGSSEGRERGRSGKGARNGRSYAKCGSERRIRTSPSAVPSLSCFLPGFSLVRPEVSRAFFTRRHRGFSPFENPVGRRLLFMALESKVLLGIEGVFE